MRKLNTKTDFTDWFEDEREDVEKFVELLKPMDEEGKLKILMLIEGYTAGLRYSLKRTV